MKGRSFFVTALLCACAVLITGPAHAQFAGHNTKGDFGLQSGSQAPPGFYVVAPMYYRYDGDSVKNRNGDSVSLRPRGARVTGRERLRSRPRLGERIQDPRRQLQLPDLPRLHRQHPGSSPILDLDESVDTGFTDLYFQPVNLGWHRDRADFIAGLGVFAPTGKYEAGGSDNLGLGMWSFELFAGTTVYLDEAKSWHFATTAFFETHTEKEDTDIKVGNLLTLEGGLGKSFMEGAVNVGAAYYAQWKLSDDDLGLGIELPGGRGLASTGSTAPAPSSPSRSRRRRSSTALSTPATSGNSGRAARWRGTRWCSPPRSPFPACRCSRNRSQSVELIVGKPARREEGPA